MEMDKGLEAICGDSIIPPEMDNYEEDVEEFDDMASFRYSALDIRDHLGHEDFKEVYTVQSEYVKNFNNDDQRTFLIEILEKIAEIYDWEFSDEYALVDTVYQQKEMYEFIEFLEFANYKFLAYVWKFLLKDPIQLAKLNIRLYCEGNPMLIIKETEEQLETHPQSKLISVFLRTYYKERYIEWFVTMSERFKFEIISEIYE
jgi:hypothetical protein